jgi:hypothetical protein
MLWPIATILFLYPIRNTFTRCGLVLALLGLWLGCLYFGRRKRAIRLSLLVISFFCAAFLVCPGRNYDPEQLRNAYIRSLRSFEGTRYIWGGENNFGIDCSGLVRAGLIKASFQQGLLTWNPKLMRFALSLWWHDSSAKALGEEYRQKTKRLFMVGSINELDQTKVLPGDIAVTKSGVHVLACLGAGEWIEADPHFSKVIIVEIPAVKNPWFQEPVHIMRWTILEEK